MVQLVADGRSGGAVWVAALLLGACSPPVPTVPGPESPQLARRVSGFLVWDEPPGGMTAMSLPDGKRSVVRPTVPANSAVFSHVHAVSGPDAEGRIAYLEDQFFTADAKDRKHRLKTIRIDGTGDTIVFERPGSAMWATSSAGKGETGAHLALAPVGGKAVLLRNVVARQMRGSGLSEGCFECWDVAARTRLDVDLKGLDYPMTWLPDGRRLLYSALVPRAQLPPGAHGLDTLGADEQSWDAVPSIHVFDLATGRTEFLHIGTEAVPVGDGNTAWVGGWVGQTALAWSRIDLDTGEVRAASIPGLAGRILAAPADDLVLYWGWPTQGTEVRWSSVGSRPGGRPLLTIKVAEPRSQSFATLVTYLHPVRRISFGATPQ